MKRLFAGVLCVLLLFTSIPVNAATHVDLKPYGIQVSSDPPTLDFYADDDEYKDVKKMQPLAGGFDNGATFVGYAIGPGSGYPYLCDATDVSFAVSWHNVGWWRYDKANGSNITPNKGHVVGQNGSSNYPARWIKGTENKYVKILDSAMQSNVTNFIRWHNNMTETKDDSSFCEEPNFLHYHEDQRDSSNIAAFALKVSTDVDAFLTPAVTAAQVPTTWRNPKIDWDATAKFWMKDTTGSSQLYCHCFAVDQGSEKISFMAGDREHGNLKITDLRSSAAIVSNHDKKCEWLAALQCSDGSDVTQAKIRKWESKAAKTAQSSTPINKGVVKRKNVTAPDGITVYIYPEPNVVKTRVPPATSHFSFLGAIDPPDNANKFNNMLADAGIGGMTSATIKDISIFGEGEMMVQNEQFPTNVYAADRYGDPKDKLGITPGSKAAKYLIGVEYGAKSGIQAGPIGYMSIKFKPKKVTLNVNGICNIIALSTDRVNRIYEATAPNTNAGSCVSIGSLQLAVQDCYHVLGEIPNEVYTDSSNNSYTGITIESGGSYPSASYFCSGDNIARNMNIKNNADSFNDDKWIGENNTNKHMLSAGKTACLGNRQTYTIQLYAMPNLFTLRYNPKRSTDQWTDFPIDTLPGAALTTSTTSGAYNDTAGKVQYSGVTVVPVNTYFSRKYFHVSSEDEWRVVHEQNNGCENQGSGQHESRWSRDVPCNCRYPATTTAESGTKHCDICDGSHQTPTPSTDQKVNAGGTTTGDIDPCCNFDKDITVDLYPNWVPNHMKLHYVDAGVGAVGEDYDENTSDGTITEVLPEEVVSVADDIYVKDYPNKDAHPGYHFVGWEVFQKTDNSAYTKTQVTYIPNGTATAVTVDSTKIEPKAENGYSAGVQASNGRKTWFIPQTDVDVCADKTKPQQFKKLTLEGDADTRDELPHIFFVAVWEPDIMFLTFHSNDSGKSNISLNGDTFTNSDLVNQNKITEWTVDEFLSGTATMDGIAHPNPNANPAETPLTDNGCDVAIQTTTETGNTAVKEFLNPRVLDPTDPTHQKTITEYGNVYDSINNGTNAIDMKSEKEEIVTIPIRVIDFEDLMKKDAFKWPQLTDDSKLSRKDEEIRGLSTGCKWKRSNNFGESTFMGWAPQSAVEHYMFAYNAGDTIDLSAYYNKYSEGATTVATKRWSNFAVYAMYDDNPGILLSSMRFGVDNADANVKSDLLSVNNNSYTGKTHTRLEHTLLTGCDTTSDVNLESMTSNPLVTTYDREDGISSNKGQNGNMTRSVVSTEYKRFRNNKLGMHYGWDSSDLVQKGNGVQPYVTDAFSAKRKEGNSQFYLETFPLNDFKNNNFAQEHHFTYKIVDRYGKFYTINSEFSAGGVKDIMNGVVN